MKFSLLFLVLSQVFADTVNLDRRGIFRKSGPREVVFYGKLAGLSAEDLELVTEMKLCGMPRESTSIGSNEVLQGYIDNYLEGDISTATEFAKSFELVCILFEFLTKRTVRMLLLYDTILYSEMRLENVSRLRSPSCRLTMGL